MPLGTESSERGVHAGLRQRAWKGLLWTLSGEGAVAVLRILTLVVLARLLTPEEFGIMTAALVIVEFSRIFIYMGIAPAIVQLPNLGERHLSTGLISSFVFGLVVQLAVWTSAPAVAAFFETEGLVPVLRALSFVFPLRGLSMVALSLLQREMRFREIARIDVGAYVVAFTPVAVGLALAGAGEWALVIGYLANVLVVNTMYLWSRPPPLMLGWSWGALRDLLRFGSGITLARLANYFGSSADNLIVGRMLGITALGLYGRAYGLMSSAVKVTGGVLDKVFFSVIAKVQDDPRRLQKGFWDAQSGIALGMLPVSAFLFALAPETIFVMLGPQWMEAVPVFQVFALGLLFRTGHRVSLSVARGTGAVYRLAWTQLVYALAVVGGALVGQRWGLEGVAIGVLAAMFLGYAVAASIALRITNLGWIDFLKMHRLGAGLGVLVYGLSWSTAAGLRWLGAPSLAVLAAALAVSGAVSVVVVRRTVVRLMGQDAVGEMREFIMNKRARLTRSHVPSPASET